MPPALRASSQEIDAYLDEHGATHSCPMCTRDVWSIPASAEEIAVQDGNLPLPRIGLFITDEALIGAGMIPCFAMVCATCGFVRLQSRDMFQAWLEKQKERAE